MTEMQIQQSETRDGEVSLKELIIKTKVWVSYLSRKWLIIFAFGIVGAVLGYLYAASKKPVYTATLSFALEEENAGTGGLSGAMGLATSLGLDMGNTAGGAFSGSNLMALMTSRTLVEKALLNPITINNRQISLATYFIELSKMNENWDQKPELKAVKFEPLSNRSGFTLQHDSIMGILYNTITGSGILSVSQKDKKISIISIDVVYPDQLFAKGFAESIAKEVSEFYVETKSKKAKINVDILQRQSDSIRSELNGAITGVASYSDKTFNLNPAYNVKKAPSIRRQVDVQANTVILTQLVANLEMAKVTLRKETPLIQVIDRPILPLRKEGVSKLKYLILGGILGASFILLVLIGRRTWNIILAG